MKEAGASNTDSDPFSDGALFGDYEQLENIIDVKTEYLEEEDGENGQEKLEMISEEHVPNLLKKAPILTNILSGVPYGDSIYICEVCRKHCKDYWSLGDHRRKRHKLAFRQERLGASFQIDTSDLHPGRQRQKSHVQTESRELHPQSEIKNIPPAAAPKKDSVYICQICHKDYDIYRKLKYHRKHTHGVQARQEFLGRNFDIPTETLHPLPSAMKDYSLMTPFPATIDPLESREKALSEDSIYVCEACSKVYRNYQSLGEHRRRTHKLPFRQNTLGRNGEISSFDLHPENKNTAKTAMVDSVYVCEVCANDYRTYQNLKYHRKHTHKLPGRQEKLGINGDIETNDLHPVKNCTKEKPPWKKSNSKTKAQTMKCDSVYVCEVCKNDYKNYQNLKYHRKNTHGIAPRQTRLGINGEIDTDDYHPLKRFQKVQTNGEISVHPNFPNGLAQKQYKTEMYYQRLVKHLEILQRTEEKNDTIKLEIETIQEIQSLRNESSQTGHSELFLKKLKSYRLTLRRKFDDVDDDFPCFEDCLQTSTSELDPLIESPTGLFFVENDLDIDNTENDGGEEQFVRQENSDHFQAVNQEIIDGNEIYIKEEPEYY